MHEKQHKKAKGRTFNLLIPRPPWARETFKERHNAPPQVRPDGTVWIDHFTDELDELEEWLKHNGYAPSQTLQGGNDGGRD
jgi:hypothetical protein